MGRPAAPRPNDARPAARMRRLVIVGGSPMAILLASLVRRLTDSYEVVLIERAGDRPVAFALPLVVANVADASEVMYNPREVRGVSLVDAEVEAVDYTGRKVQVDGERVAGDVLVLAVETAVDEKAFLDLGGMLDLVKVAESLDTLSFFMSGATPLAWFVELALAFRRRFPDKTVEIRYGEVSPEASQYLNIYAGHLKSHGIAVSSATRRPRGAIKVPVARPNTLLGQVSVSLPFFEVHGDGVHVVGEEACTRLSIPISPHFGVLQTYLLAKHLTGRIDRRLDKPLLASTREELARKFLAFLETVVGGTDPLHALRNLLDAWRHR